MNVALMDESVEVAVKTSVSLAQIADTLCAALEGGVSYWCSLCVPKSYPEGTEYAHEAIAQYVPFEYAVFEEPGRKTVGNSKIYMAATLMLMAEKYPRHFGDMCGDTGDAETGDIFFQLLCFGEVVYG